ncbi:unnamed protein product [Moneuplotes crassus]|uniref:Uncharacterized protein n=1 Tax=Euplotes crassus TaxID=5936 RepID=A0AAD1Y571_EUPCR|nr:unnamed protein product [Moneuplotes crassus]
MEQTKDFWHLTTSKTYLTELKTPKIQPQLYKPEFPTKERKRHRKRRSKDYEQLFSEIHTTTPKTPLPTPNPLPLPLQNPPSTPNFPIHLFCTHSNTPSKPVQVLISCISLLRGAQCVRRGKVINALIFISVETFI